MNVICNNDAPVFSREVEPLTIVDPLDQAICEQVACTLLRHYPGHDWLVEADYRKGFIDIRNVSLDGQMGCRIPMKGYASSSELDKLAMRYAGEILERFGVVRGAMRRDEVDSLETDFAGRLEYEK
jgi:hypothetical protein